MSEPTTPTGQAIMRYGQQSEASMSPEEWRTWWKQRILTIEAEAREQERERLRAEFEGLSIHVRGPSDLSAEYFFTRDGMDYVIDLTRAILSDPESEP